MAGKIDGKLLAQHILTELSGQVTGLKEKGIVPKLRVILIGDDPGSISYIKQKTKAGEQAGIAVDVVREQTDIGEEAFRRLISDANSDPDIHGLVIQRPVPMQLYDVSEILNSVAPAKDVDGFLPGSPYPVPVAAAVEEILLKVKSQMSTLRQSSGQAGKSTGQTSEVPTSPRLRGTGNTISFLAWLKAFTIVIIGRGETAGRPIFEYLRKLNPSVTQIHSETEHPETLLKSADIIISCVGKPNIVRHDLIKKGSILISVGLSRDMEGKLHGDYEETDILDTAAFYTPTPGGVGPVNVACLMRNVMKAACYSL